MKIQPVDFREPVGSIHCELAKPVAKSLFKRLFERQLSNVLKISAVDKSSGVDATYCNKDGFEESEPSSVCLASMVQNYMEGCNEKLSTTLRCGQSTRNCFKGNSTDSSEDESDTFMRFGDSNHISSSDALGILKSLVFSATVSERNLLADTTKIVEKEKIWKRKDGLCRKIVIDGLVALGYDASVCKSRWEKSPSCVAGEYEYVDVIVEGGERLIIDIDFRSEFEIARPTRPFKAILQSLPRIFVGKAERLQRIICVVSEAAKLSLKKRGMHFPPWRKAEFVKAKWLSPYTRSPTSPATVALDSSKSDVKSEKEELPLLSNGEFELLFGDSSSSSPVDANRGEAAFAVSDRSGEGDGRKNLVVKKQKNSQTRVKIVTGLAFPADDQP